MKNKLCSLIECHTLLQVHHLTLSFSSSWVAFTNLSACFFFQRNFFLVMCMVQRINSEYQWGIKPQTFGFHALMVYHWVTKTLWWARPLEGSHVAHIPDTARISTFAKFSCSFLMVNRKREDYWLTNWRKTHYKSTRFKSQLSFNRLNSQEWTRKNFSFQYQCNIKQTSDKGKEKYQLGD